MAFPAFGTEVPSLQTYQCQYRGYTFGPNTPFELTKIEGIDLPTVRSGDAGRPRTHGMFTGLDVLAGREITITGQVHKDEVSFQHALGNLAAATVPGGTVEEPLFLSLPGYGILATLARVRKRSMPVDITFALGNLADVVLLFAASDPRLYAPTESVSTNATGTSAGFHFPMGFPLSFGGGSSVGVLNITNSGNIFTCPILVIEGPCEYPSITNSSITGSPTLTFNLLMDTGDKLIIDTDLHTATYYTSGTTIGSSRLNTLALGSSWWVLNPGLNAIQFASLKGTGKLMVQAASGYLI